MAENEKITYVFKLFRANDRNVSGKEKKNQLVVSVSVYLGTTINKHQIMPQKTNHIRTAFILFPGHLKQPYGFLVRCPDT